MTQSDETTGAPALPDEPGLRRWIVDRLAAATGVDPGEVDPTATFASIGVDSVAAVELVADLETLVGRELDPTLVFSAESPAQLASVIASGAAGPSRRRRHRRTTPPPGPDGSTTTDADDPIAVVGIGCRLPGASGPDAYWRMLLDGVDAVSEVPEGRWEHDPSLPASVDRGGFVDGIDQFDPGFFGITQLEADRMDPQQRMLLEVAWEALEDAAVRPSTLRGTDVGVFVGISTNEYSRRQSASPDLVDVFFGTGNALSIAANRISYALDLHGPSIAVDTACSSSLVAVHLACASLRRGECTSALAGGANAILTPLLTLNFTGAGVIAPDGRCKTFDAAADGIVRGEGAGLVHLKRLSDAIADGDRVYCTIEGSATNQDGRSNGLTAPDPDAQVDVFAAACAAAGVDPLGVDYVEAHGTGTVLGDAMELRSLDAVYGEGRPPDAPLLVGSVKTNIGHLESAAGIAGLIKAALSVRHGTIPPTLHYREPNPYLSETNHLKVVDEVLPWAREGVRRAAVSGFGFGGTNAHVILSSAPEPSAPIPASPGSADEADAAPIVLPLSARSAGALEASVRRHAAVLEADPSVARDLAAAQALSRDEHPRRLAVVGTDGASIASALAEVADGRRSGAAIAGERRSTEPARVAFLFSGQGRAWWPLDHELLADPVIGSLLRTCDTELREIADFSLMELIRSGEAVLDHERAQPLLFALQVALAARWRAFGVEPDMIVGQSIGEIAAAHVAGALPLADALEIVLHRGRLMEESNGTGHTAFVELPAADVETMIAELGLDVAIAAVTAPDNCVVSGPKVDTVTIVETAAERGVMAQVFDVGDIPGHGPLMAPYAEKLAAAVDFLDPRPTTVPMISSVTAAVVDGEDLDAGYWGRNLRQQVRLLEAIGVAVDRGAELFIEIAPHPVVSFSTRRTLESLGSDARVQHTVKQGEPGTVALRRALASAWATGARVDWRAVTGRTRAPIAALASAWDHRRCWFDLTPPPPRHAPARSGARRHPLLDDPIRLGDGTTTWRAVDGPAVPGDTATPGLGTLLGLAVSATVSDAGDAGVLLSEVHLASGVERILAEDGARGRLAVNVRRGPQHLRWWVTLDLADGSTGPGVTILARGDARALDDPVPEMLPPDRLAVDPDDGSWDATTADLPAGITGVRVDGRTAVLDVDVPRTRDDLPSWTVAPVLLDAVAVATSRFGSAEPDDTGHPELRRIGELRVRAGVEATRVVVDRTSGEVVAVDEWGAPVVELRAPGTGPARPSAPGDDLVTVRRTALAAPGDRTAGAASGVVERRWILLAPPDDEPAAALAAGLGATISGLDDLTERVDADPDLSVVLWDPPPDVVRTLLDRPSMQRRVVRLVTRGGPACALVPTLLRSHAEADLRAVDLLDTAPDSGEPLLDPVASTRLVDLVRLPDIPDVTVLGRDGARGAHLHAASVPDVVAVLAPAAGRRHAAVWSEDGTIRIAPMPPPDLAGSGDPDRADRPVLLRVERALLPGADAELRTAGELAGTAAVGTVTVGPATLLGRTFAVVAPGTATTELLVDPGRLWPVPDRDRGIDALVALAALQPDLPAAVDRDPAALAAAFDAILAADRHGEMSLLGLGDLAGARPDAPTVVAVGDPSTPVEDRAGCWSTTGEWAVLAAEDDPFGDDVVSWLRDRGAVVVAPDELGSSLAGVVLVGDAPVEPVEALDGHVVWIGPSSILLGGADLASAELRAAAATASRRHLGGPTTTFLIGAGTDRRAALAVLDRVLLDDVDVAAYDPEGVEQLASSAPEADGWFAGLSAPTDLSAPDTSEGSVTAALLAASSVDHAAIVARHLAEEIAAIIGIDVTGIDHAEPVDTYGVDSLVGMEMRSRILAGFAYEVPLSELSRSMTVADLAAHLVEHAVPGLVARAASTPGSTADGTETPAEARSRAVPVRRGDGPTTWWVPGIFGSAEVFGPLGAVVADGVMWALESNGDPAGSVTAVATSHLAAIRSHQPVGPYRIGGYSYGALVATEIALTLESAGEVVEHLWLLDPPPPFAPEDAATRAHRAGRVAELLAEHLADLFGTTGIGVEDLPPLSVGADLAPLVERVVAGGTPWTTERISTHLRRIWDTTAVSLDAMATHRPTGVLDAAASLVVAGRSGLFDAVPEADWNDVLANVAGPTTFDTDHTGLMEADHAAAVAEVIRRSLGATTRASAHPEEPMSTDTARPTFAQRARAAVIEGLTTSERSRSAVGAVGNAYRQADFFLRALGAERRFRRMCVTGDDFIVGEHAQIANLSGDPGRIRFGDNCLVDGYVNLQEYGYLTVGSYSGIGVDARIDCSGYVEIGNGCTMAEGVYIIDGLHHPILADERIKHGIDLFRGNHVMDAYGPGTETSFVRIEDLVWIGIRAIVLSGVTIGRGSVVAAGAVVSQDVPPFSVVAGNPARVVGRIPEEDFDIESHPTFIEAHGDRRLPDNRRPVRDVLEEIRDRVAARRR